MKKLGYYMYWMQVWAWVREYADIGRLLMVGDVNSAFKKSDRAIPRTRDIVYRQLCRVVGLKDLSEMAYNLRIHGPAS